MQWRKQGDEQWQSVGLPLKNDGNKELVFINFQHHHHLRCAKCKTPLNETPYLWYRTVPQTTFTLFTQKWYCLKHTPISIEIDMQQRPIPGQVKTKPNEADSEPAAERPLVKAGVELPQILWWRKQGDHETWQFVLLPLKSNGKELQFIFAQQQNQFCCATCGKSLSRAQYLLYRPTPYTRYCIEHSPIPIETQGGPGLFQRLEDLERRVAELEARMDSSGKPDSEQ